MGYYIEEVDLTHLHSNIMKFINDFKALHRKETEDLFSGGYCYWLAFILKERFKYANPHIMYNDVKGHFACMIRSDIYDITGIIPASDKSDYEYWEEYKSIEKEAAERITRDCILKIPVKD